MSELPKAGDYKKFFSIDSRIPCWNAECILRGSCGRADLIVFCNASVGHVYLRSDKESACLDEGVSLYSDAEKYEEYKREFTEYIRVAQETVIPKYSQIRTIESKTELEEDMSFIAKMWWYYGFTEFMYVDRAYGVAIRANNREMLARLEELGQFKFESRKVFNTYFFTDGTMHTLRKSLSKQFNYTHHESLYPDEMLALFDGARLDDAEAIKRKECYAASVRESEIHRFDYASSHIINVNFTRVVASRELRGVIANRGIARGVAVVLGMPDDHQYIAQIDARMKKGDILVTESTSPDLMALCTKAGAIVVNQGGMLSHAAVISRELGVPCVMQTINATEIIKDGDMVEVDANNGIVRRV